MSESLIKQKYFLVICYSTGAVALTAWSKKSSLEEYSLKELKGKKLLRMLSQFSYKNTHVTDNFCMPFDPTLLYQSFKRL